MRVQIAQPSATPQQIEAHLRASFPRYSVKTRAGAVIVGDGAATGVLLKPSGPGAVTLAWAFPSMAVQLLLTLSMIFTGILPGLLIFLIVWLVVKGGVARLKQEVATVLSGGTPMQAAFPAGGAGAADPGPFAAIAGAVCFVMALLGVVQMLGVSALAGGGIFSALGWVGLGVGLILRHTEDKRAFAQGTPRSGPGLLVAGISAALLGLLVLVSSFSGSGLYMVRGLVAALFWLAAGGLGIAVQFGKVPKAAPMLWGAGAVLILFGLLAFYDVVAALGIGAPFNVFILIMIVRGLLWLGLGGVAFGGALAAGKSAGVGGPIGWQGAVQPAGYGQPVGYAPQPMPPQWQQQPEQPGYPPGQAHPQEPQQPQQPGYPPGQGHPQAPWTPPQGPGPGPGGWPPATGA